MRLLQSLMKSAAMVFIMTLMAGVVAVDTLNAATISAASCSEADVQRALSSAGPGDTVMVPAGTCTWTTPLYYTAPANLTIQGQTVCTGSGNPSQNNLACTDMTVIVDGLNRSSSDQGMLNLGTASSGSFRLTGITFGWGGGGITSNGSVRFTVVSSQFRVDHVHFNKINSLAFTHVDAVGAGGVFDHILLDGYNGSGWRDYGDFNAQGDTQWAAATSLGAANFMYFEDSRFNTASNDCISGGRWIVRYSTFSNNGVQTHPTGGSGRARGCRAWELYGNQFINATTNNFNVFYMSSGTGVVWGNDAGANRFSNFVTAHSMRQNNRTYPMAAAPNGWGYCGTSFNGTGSNWDQNSNAASGSACLDQPGQGVGDRLSGDFPNVVNLATGCTSSAACAWPRQALEPVYEWMNIWSCQGCGGSFWAVYEPTALVQNRDFYLQASPFTGAAGTGTGSLANRPQTCTPNVAYWATDVNTLFQCKAGNSWSPYYKPYTYPHPLTANGSGDTTPPSVSISVQ